MIEINRVSTSNYSGKCPFADRCTSQADSYYQIRIIADRKLYRQAKAQGLRPELVDERMVTSNYFSQAKVTEIALCPPALKDQIVLDGLRSFLAEADAPSDTYVDDTQELEALREVDGIIHSDIEIDEIRTELGMDILDRVTSGERIDDFPLRYRLADLNGILEIIPVYELDKNPSEGSATANS